MRRVLPALHSLMVGLSYVQRVATQATAQQLAIKEKAYGTIKVRRSCVPNIKRCVFR